MTATPPYPPGQGLLAGKTVLVTAAAGTGIGFATAKRCVEEGARVVITDIHERRLARVGRGARRARHRRERDVGRRRAALLRPTSVDELGTHRRAREQRRPRRHRRARRDDRRAVVGVLDVTLTGHDAHDARRAARTCTRAVRA